MTEKEWLSGEDPAALIAHLCDLRLNRTKANRRKFWLFACGCCRCVWHLFETEPVCAEMIAAAERFADGAGPFIDVQSCDRRLNVPNYGRVQYVMMAARSLAYTNVQIVATTAATACASAMSHGLLFPDYTPNWSRELSRSACLLRCIFGNPFRRTSFNPAWRTSDVMLLAQGIYDERAFDRMPILADALQDAGCDNADILAHCRDATTPHARGCWVVDSILGKT